MIIVRIEDHGELFFYASLTKEDAVKKHLSENSDCTTEQELECCREANEQEQQLITAYDEDRQKIKNLYDYAKEIELKEELPCLISSTLY